MDAIRKKMKSLKSETDALNTVIRKFEDGLAVVETFLTDDYSACLLVNWISHVLHPRNSIINNQNCKMRDRHLLFKILCLY